MATPSFATVEDLYRSPEKAELVNGELVAVPLSGQAHGRAALAVAASLRGWSRRTGVGEAFGDSVGFLVQLPRRRSFSPDAALHAGGEFGPRFLDGAPLLAVEVRSSEQYGRLAEIELAAKRADYFAAGTLVVWDVDVLRERVVRVYRASAPQCPTVYGPGELAEAEPAAPGWTLAVDELF